MGFTCRLTGLSPDLSAGEGDVEQKRKKPKYLGAENVIDS